MHKGVRRQRLNPRKGSGNLYNALCKGCDNWAAVALRNAE